jgi:hypothetical protein
MASFDVGAERLDDFDTSISFAPLPQGVGEKTVEPPGPEHL